MPAMTRDEIEVKIRELLVDVLAVDEHEVTPEARLTKDLGAESIDFLDIVFRLEQAFGIKINQGELFPQSIAQDQKFVKDGKVTDEGIALLKERLPHADFSGLGPSPAVRDVAEIFTVGALIKFIERRLA